MITSKAIKEVVAQFKRTEPPVVAVVGDKVQLYQPADDPALIFEIPKDEVSDEVIEKYQGDPLNLERLLIASGYEEYDGISDWRRHLLGKEIPHETMTEERDVVRVEDDKGEQHDVDVMRFTLQPSGEKREMKVSLYDFFRDQLLRPIFKSQPGTAWNKEPYPITIWEGDELVGVVANLDLEVLRTD